MINIIPVYDAATISKRKETVLGLVLKNRSKTHLP
jgi:hypothetical protein